jgi:glycosyltransferase involved in cell wall biosynthesis
MKILIVNGTDITRIGGVHIAIREVARRLVAGGDDCTVISINSGGLPSEELIDGIHVVRVESPISKYSLEISPELGYRFVEIVRKDFAPDIIHLHGYNTLLSHEMALLCRIQSRGFVFSPHYSPFAHTHPIGAGAFAVGRPIGKLIFRLADRVLCVSRFESNLVSEHFGVPKDRISVIPNGVSYIHQRKVHGWGSADDKCVRLLYVGYLLRLKGIQHIMAAVRVLKHHRKQDVVLRIVGSGIHEAWLKRISRELDIADNVEWIGELGGESLDGEYRNADVFLLLSDSENYGTVVAEALSNGTPCVVTTNSALKEFTNERGCYGIENPSDAEKLADLILEIVKSGDGVGPLTGSVQTWNNVSRSIREAYSQAICES